MAANPNPRMTGHQGGRSVVPHVALTVACEVAASWSIQLKPNTTPFKSCVLSMVSVVGSILFHPLSTTSDLILMVTIAILSF